MALTDETGGIPATMLVSPSGGGMNNGDFGGGGWWWIILLFVLLGGWGNGGMGGMNGGGLYPWMNQSNQISGGFQNQMLNDNITGIRSDIAGIGAQLNANQLAELERSFAAQTATTAGMTGIQAQLAQCCCDNRLASADLKYTVATENCADRAASAQNARDIIDAQTRGTQAILDKLCALELDGVKNQLAAAQRENVGLQNQLNMANLAASQTAQNAFIQQGFSAEVDALYNRLRNCPVPSQPVYGMTPIFTCPGNNCGNM